MEIDYDLNIELKPINDWSKAAETAIKEAEEIAKVKFLFLIKTHLETAVENLLIVEKSARLSFDGVSGSLVCLSALKLTQTYSKNLDVLLNLLTTIVKRRSQLKRVIVDSIQFVIQNVLKTYEQSLIEKEKILKTVLSLTEAKLFLERERATTMLDYAVMLENRGEIIEAYNNLELVNIETCTDMLLRQKIEYILKQMQLLIDANDFNRFSICYKRIYTSTLENEEYDDLTIQFYSNMIIYHVVEKNFIEAFKCQIKIYETKHIQNNKELKKNAAEKFLLFLLISNICDDKLTLLSKCSKDYKEILRAIAPVRVLLSLFLSNNLIEWPLENEENIKKSVFYAENTQILQKVKENRIKTVPQLNELDLWLCLKRSIQQHNIFIISKYFTKLSFNSLSYYLKDEFNICEEILIDMIKTKFTLAKIDRPGKFIYFGASNDDIINAWVRDINSVQQSLNEISYLIKKDRMIESIKQ